jgi:hypothetical protein
VNQQFTALSFCLKIISAGILTVVIVLEEKILWKTLKIMPRRGFEPPRGINPTMPSTSPIWFNSFKMVFLKAVLVSDLNRSHLITS